MNRRTLLGAALAPLAVVAGRRWSLRLPVADAREALGRLTTGAAFVALDDFTLATPTLEDVYLALGGSATDEGPSDARWVWALVLVLLGAETVLRRRLTHVEHHA